MTSIQLSSLHFTRLVCVLLCSCAPPQPAPAGEGVGGEDADAAAEFREKLRIVRTVLEQANFQVGAGLWVQQPCAFKMHLSTLLCQLLNCSTAALVVARQV